MDVEQIITILQGIIGAHRQARTDKAPDNFYTLMQYEDKIYASLRRGWRSWRDIPAGCSYQETMHADGTMSKGVCTNG